MKLAYIAHDLGSPEFEYPTGRKTRYYLCEGLARIYAEKSGYDHYSVEGVCVCHWYRQGLSDAWKARKPLSVIKHAVIGAIKYIQFKIHAKTR